MGEDDACLIAAMFARLFGLAIDLNLWFPVSSGEVIGDCDDLLSAAKLTILGYLIRLLNLEFPARSGVILGEGVPLTSVASFAGNPTSSRSTG